MSSKNKELVSVRIRTEGREKTPSVSKAFAESLSRPILPGEVVEVTPEEAKILCDWQCEVVD